MSWLSRIFGGGGDPAPTAVEYNGFRIVPMPEAIGGEYRLRARIEADRDGETLSHDLIRADLIRSREEAEQAAIFKAQQLIDQMGMGLFR